METRSQSGQFRTVKTVYADLDGGADLRTVMVLVSGTTNGQNSLYAAYSTSSNKVYLRRADNSDWMPGAVLGSATVLDNGYGKLDVTQTTVSRSGITLTVNWVAAFTSSATGTRSVYLRALDQKGAGSGWAALGRWVWEAAVDDRNHAPTNVDLTPQGDASNADEVVEFRATYQNVNGAEDLQEVRFRAYNDRENFTVMTLSYDASDNTLWARDEYGA